MQERTDWPQVVLLIATGVIGACQIGKAAIAAQLLRDDLGLSLVAVSWVVGAYAVLGAVAGMGMGFVVSRFALRRVVLAGLALLAAGNFIGAAAPDITVLLLARALEGVGFLAMMIAAPTLLRSVVTARVQQIVFAFWAAYMPAGVALMLLAGPAIMQGDWRMLWIFNGVLAALHVLAMWLWRPKGMGASLPVPRPRWQDVADLCRSVVPLVLAAAFVLYAVQYFALSTFLPIFLVERMGLTLAAAGSVSAAALMANAVGNICAGVVLRLGAPLWVMMVVVFVTIGVAGVAIFSPAAPVTVAAVAAAACLGLTALLPASVIVSMPRFAPGVQALALAMGLVQQASSIAQMAGPAVLAFWVERWGWGAVPQMFGLICVTGLGIALVLRRFTRG